MPVRLQPILTKFCFGYKLRVPLFAGIVVSLRRGYLKLTSVSTRTRTQCSARLGVLSTG